jgi:hypothetical protein
VFLYWAGIDGRMIISFSMNGPEIDSPPIKNWTETTMLAHIQSTQERGIEQLLPI